MRRVTFGDYSADYSHSLSKPRRNRRLPQRSCQVCFGSFKNQRRLRSPSCLCFVMQFIREFETPAKIVTQTYVAQLRAHQAEIRPMVKQALENLVHALPSRQDIPSTESGKVPIWIQGI